MSKKSAQLDREIATALEAAWITARDTARDDPTPANREAAKVAWTALTAATPKRPGTGLSSRAGQRQAAERRAQHPWKPSHARRRSDKFLKGEIAACERIIADTEKSLDLDPRSPRPRLDLIDRMQAAVAELRAELALPK